MLALVTHPGVRGATEVADMPEPRPAVGGLLSAVEVGVCGTDREISGLVRHRARRRRPAHPRARAARPRRARRAQLRPRRPRDRDRAPLVRTAAPAWRARPTRAPPATMPSTASRGCMASPPSSPSWRPSTSSGPGVARRLGVLAEPASICARALRHRADRRAPAVVAGRALVLGAGAIGMLSTYLLRLDGLEVWTAALEPPGARRRSSSRPPAPRYVAAGRRRPRSPPRRAASTS